MFDASFGFCAGLGIEMRLSALGVAADDLDVMADDAFAIRRLLDNNPRELGRTTFFRSTGRLLRRQARRGQMIMSTSRVAVTLGDPAGVGPEVIVKALAALPEADRREFRHRRQCRSAGAGKQGDGHGAAVFRGAGVPASLRSMKSRSTAACRRSARSAPSPATLRSLHQAGRRLAMSGDVDCIVTAPINKEAMNLAGHHFDGHTGLLAHLTGSKSSFMLLASERLNTIQSRRMSRCRTQSSGDGRAGAGDDPGGAQAFPSPRAGKPADRRGGHQSALRRERPVRHRGR